MKRLAPLCLSFCLAAAISAALPEAAGLPTSDLPPSTNAAAQPCPIVVIPEYMTTNNSVTARRSMTDALLAAGVVPVVLPEMDDASADQVLALCDAVLLGGAVPGQDGGRRRLFEERILALAEKRGLTVVGICHGCQIINRYYGGTRTPVPEERKLVHQDNALRRRTGMLAEHGATVLPGNSLMSRTLGEGRVMVNSSHKYRCEEIAPGFRVTAVSEEDGIVEAIEHETKPIYGFQFHPESYRRKDPRFLNLIRNAFETRP